MTPTPTDHDREMASKIADDWYMGTDAMLDTDDVAHLAARIADALAEQRERDAKIADTWGARRHVDDLDLDDSKWRARQIAAAIRAGGGA